ncbi:MAG: chromosome segregation SMC family protein, partial [Ktedonobacterales bacterium]
MAYLKRLELHGFKSFAHRSALEFSPGITAIVGPNGSGKSNLADSIRWVLGEQSMRQLRGKKSDDVIFAGGQGRAAAQMAQVGLVLDNSAAWIPSDYSEVTVARRSFRSGESEYLSNGQRVRLRDVLLLLAQARIGHDSYTVIGQGQIDQALSLRAEERRALFEDAAGIRQFQSQRTEAEQKLALTQSNLARLRDIIGEIEPRLAPLAEQARRAAEFTSAREELLRLLRVWYRRQWHELGQARDRAETAEHDFAARIETLRQALDAASAGANTVRSERETLLTEIASLRRERGETSGRLQTTERDLAVGRERLASLNRQQTDLDAEREEQTEAVVVARAHIGALEAQVAAAEEHVEAASASVERLERGQHAAHQEQEREEARLRAAQREVIQAQSRLGATQTELGRLQRQIEERNRSLATRREAVEKAQQVATAAERQLAGVRDAFEAARAQVEVVVARREQLAQEIADGQAEIERLRMAAADAERERRARADRLALLDEWQRSLSGFSDGARALLQAPDDARPAIIGVVGRLASAPDGLEAALEAAFGDFLRAVVVASRQDALDAASWLRVGGHGNAVIAWSDGLLGTAQDSPQAQSQKLPPADGKDIFGLARKALNCGAAERPALERLLGETLIVRDLAVAERRWGADGPPVPVVTLAGEALHPLGWLRGGASIAEGASVAEGADRQAEESTLARERELRQLPDELARRASGIADLRGQLDAATTAQVARRAQDDALKREAQHLEAVAQERAKALAALQREQERAESDVHLSEAVMAQLAAESQTVESDLAATLAQAQEQERAHRDAAERADDAQAEVDDLALRNRAQLEELTRARTALALQQQEVKTLAQRADQVRAQTREVETQLARRNERLRFIQAQHEELLADIATQEGEIADLRERVRLLGEGLREREGRQIELERQ